MDGVELDDGLETRRSELSGRGGWEGAAIKD